MTRLKTVLGVVAVMAAMLMAFAAPAMADEWDDWNGWNYNTDSEWYDDVCSPGLPDGIFIPGCIFSDAEDFLDEDDVDFRFHDEDFFDNDNDNNDNEREVVRVIDRD